MPDTGRPPSLALANPRDRAISLLGSKLVQFAVMWHLTIETRTGAVLPEPVVGV
jgi:hypothetical protein